MTKFNRWVVFILSSLMVFMMNMVAYAHTTETGSLIVYYENSFLSSNGSIYDRFEIPSDLDLNYVGVYIENISDNPFIVSVHQETPEGVEIVSQELKEHSSDLIIGNTTFKGTCYFLITSTTKVPVSANIRIELSKDKYQLEKRYGLSDSASDWAKGDIDRAVSLEFIPNNLQNSYTNAINREDFCTIAYNMLSRNGKLNADNKSAGFKDIESIEINSLVSAGIINGRDKDVFAPKDCITREEATTILVRAAKFTEMNVINENIFKYDDENDVSDWAKDSIYVAQQLGLMEGVGNNRFAPKSQYTKEQAVVTLMRLYDKLS